MSSEFFATRATSLSCNPNSSGKQSTLVKKEIEFLHANLCEVRVDSDYGYGSYGTEGRSHWAIHHIEFYMFCALHNRGQGKVAEIIRKWYFQSSLLFLLSILGLQFSGIGKRLRKTEDEYSQGRPCQGFHVYITKQLDLSMPFVC